MPHMKNANTTYTPSLAARGASWTPHLLIIMLVWSTWAVLMWHGGRWQLFTEYWFMSATMALGSFIAGATSEGGGAEAFPIMTLGFGMEPHVARDFSLMIQSVGMVAAALVIVFLRITVEWRAFLCAGLGGALGVVLGLELVAPLLSAPHIKVFFVSFWLGFGAALYWINRDRKREVCTCITAFGPGSAALLFAVGIAGGTIHQIEDRLMETLSRVTDHSRQEMLEFEHEIEEGPAWNSGEVTGPGTLVCASCGAIIRFHKTGYIPNCPNCDHTVFHRKTVKDEL
jgi:hypothetical protein